MNGKMKCAGCQNAGRCKYGKCMRWLFCSDVRADRVADHMTNRTARMSVVSLEQFPVVQKTQNSVEQWQIRKAVKDETNARQEQMPSNRKLPTYLEVRQSEEDPAHMQHQDPATQTAQRNTVTLREHTVDEIGKVVERLSRNKIRTTRSQFQEGDDAESTSRATKTGPTH